MKIMEVPQFGPMFRFSDADIYWALHILSDGRRMGRKKLSDAIGIGEGSMRRIIETLREWEFIEIRQTGISITKNGLAFLRQIPIEIVDVPAIPGSVVGEHWQGVLVFNVKDKIDNGMQQRDAGIKAGASGCTTSVIRDGHLMIPPDWILDEKDPDVARAIRHGTRITEEDAIIIGSGDSRAVAIEAAINAAFELI